MTRQSRLRQNRTGGVLPASPHPWRRLGTTEGAVSPLEGVSVAFRRRDDHRLIPIDFGVRMT